MTVGLIALSGIRAVDPKIMEAGLTLPGFVERRKVVASLPSLSLLTLAALTPRDLDVEYREIQDLRTEPGPLPEYDLVALSSYSAQIGDAYRVAESYVARGTPVVMGGLHVSVLPEEARAHGATAVVGEGELLWPRVLEDFRQGALRPEYRAEPGVQLDLADAPLPRYELLEIDRYNRLTVQTSRGCPHRCTFCASSILIAPRYRVKPVERILGEIRRIKEIWPHPFIEFADDNGFVHRGHAKRLLQALRDEGIHWFTETDLSIAEDPELLTLMRESGCRQVLIGLESPEPLGLQGLETRRNWKLRRLSEYEAAIRRIQSHGVTVNGCFILGLDGQTESIFDAVEEFVERSGLYEVQITVLTPFPGTPLYEQLRRAGRLLGERAWEKCTLFDVNFVPTGMSSERLERGLLELSQRLYSREAVDRRRERFVRGLRRDAVGDASF
ncbi:MAG TPA: radical SAM protein [Candidatus Eisenbacteria bacterium]